MRPHHRGAFQLPTEVFFVIEHSQVKAHLNGLGSVLFKGFPWWTLLWVIHPSPTHLLCNVDCPFAIPTFDVLLTSTHNRPADADYKARSLGTTGWLGELQRQDGAQGKRPWWKATELDDSTRKEGCQTYSNMLQLDNISVIHSIETSSTKNKEKEKGPWNIAWRTQVGYKGEFLTVMARAGALPFPSLNSGCSCCNTEVLDVLRWSLTVPRHHSQFSNIQFKNILNWTVISQESFSLQKKRKSECARYEACVYKTCTRVFRLAFLFTKAQICEQSPCPSTSEWIRWFWYIHRREYFSAIKQQTTDTWTDSMDESPEQVGYTP